MRFGHAARVHSSSREKVWEVTEQIYHCNCKKQVSQIRRTLAPAWLVAEQAASPAMRQAIGQVWDLVRKRLGCSPEVLAFDEMTARITR